MRLRIGKRDLNLLLRIAPHGHVTVEVVLLWYPELTLSAVRSWIKRLKESKWLVSAPLDERRRYYRLSNKAIILLKKRYGVRVSRAATRPLKPLRKPERHAFLLYTCDRTVAMREPYSPGRDAARFPDIAGHIQGGKADPLRQKLFYAQGSTVGYFVLDRGHPTFVADKLLPKVQSLWKWESFRRLCDAGQFALTVVTTSVGRRHELQRIISRDAPRFHWEIVVMEEIAALLPRRRESSQPQPKSEESIS